MKVLVQAVAELDDVEHEPLLDKVGRHSFDIF